MRGITLASPEAGFIGLGALFLVVLLVKILRAKKLYTPISLIYSQAESSRRIIEGSDQPATAQTLSHSLSRASRILVLALLAAALARPQKTSVEALEPIAGVDIMIAIDTSPSMQALDFDPKNRLEAAKEITSGFIAKRKGDRIGVAAFGGAALLNCPLTLDHQAILGLLNQVQIGMTQTDGTAIGNGLMTALTYLRRVPSKSKVIILLTDGRNNAGSVDPMSAAKIAESLGVKVYTIGTGKRGGSLFPVEDPVFGKRYVRVPEEEIDEEMLAKISHQTGGKYFRATEMTELQNIFNEIDQLEKTEIESPRIVRYQELYFIPLLGALLLLGIEILARATVWFTIP